MIVKMVFRHRVGIGLAVILMLFASASAHAGMPVFEDRYQLLPTGDEVLDLRTKLIWQRCLVGQEWNGARCVGSPERFTFAQARRQEGDGWRLPSKTELEGILDHSGVKPMIHRRAFFGVGGDVWTSSIVAGASHQTSAVSFDYGFSYNALRSNIFYIRLVRNEVRNEVRN
jgi:hypothetical protein